MENLRDLPRVRPAMSPSTQNSGAVRSVTPTTRAGVAAAPRPRPTRLIQGQVLWAVLLTDVQVWSHIPPPAPPRHPQRPAWALASLARRTASTSSSAVRPMYQIPLGWQEATSEFGAAQNTTESQGVPHHSLFPQTVPAHGGSHGPRRRPRPGQTVWCYHPTPWRLRHECGELRPKPALVQLGLLFSGAGGPPKLLC